MRQKAFVRRSGKVIPDACERIWMTRFQENWRESTMGAETKIKKFVQRLIKEGDAVIASRFTIQHRPNLPYVELELFQQWRGRCRLLLSMLGLAAEPWRPVISNDSPNTFACAKSTLGALKGVKQSLEEGLLVKFEDIVLAEAFSGLWDQADYLCSQGYFLEGGVIGRAILEERLHRLCAIHHCLPGRNRPTLGDFNNELYKKVVYDKITFKHVDALAAIGNHAAHNESGLKEEDVRRLLDDLKNFLQRFAV